MVKLARQSQMFLEKMLLVFPENSPLTLSKKQCHVFLSVPHMEFIFCKYHSCLLISIHCKLSDAFNKGPLSNNNKLHCTEKVLNNTKNTIRKKADNTMVNKWLLNACSHHTDDQYEAAQPRESKPSAFLNYY